MEDNRLMKKKPTPRCQTCKYSQQNPSFHRDLIHCKYFDANALDDVVDVMRKHRCPLKVVNVYKHCLNHLKKHQITIPLPPVVTQLTDDSKSYHENVALDTVKKYHKLLKDDKIKLTAKDGLSAIKLLADIDKSNKDRKVDLVKLFANRGMNETPSSDS